ncbi:MAG: cyclic pyranopterin monophosphate synthase MoaC [Lachnospiraceae bacterium]|nr:cyclic pyranopterin monophosphate synthase MoaC [Lachnospiraceae bacterium]
MKPELFVFSGFSKSGKTTLIEKIIPKFKGQGSKVTVIKHDAHQFDIDKEGKDTFRFNLAGADSVMISSPSKSAIINEFPMSLEEMTEASGDADLIIIEGYKNAKLRKIGITSSRTKYLLPGDPSEYTAIATDDENALREAFKTDIKCPVFDLDDADKIFTFMNGCMDREVSHRVKANNEFTHFDDNGNARMVDVSDKDITLRRAVAAAKVRVNQETFQLIKDGGIKKGDVLTVAQIAGIMGSKRTPELIPMCHPVITDSTEVRLRLNEDELCVDIESAVTCTGRTGVEMEAICACSVAAMTVYDMCKAVQRDIEITDIMLVSKSGGIHGDYKRQIGNIKEGDR